MNGSVVAAFSFIAVLGKKVIQALRNNLVLFVDIGPLELRSLEPSVLVVEELLLCPVLGKPVPADFRPARSIGLFTPSPELLKPG